MTRITRVEVITDTGRDYVNWEDDNDITVSYQDNEKTLKIFVNKVKPKTGREGAFAALDRLHDDLWLGKKCPETKMEIKKLDSVESIEAEIKVLQSKLEFYKELEKTKTPCEEAYKRVYGGYPDTSTDDYGNYYDISWRHFLLGYNASKEAKQEEQVSFVPKEIKELVKEGLKWCKEHPNESVEDYLTPKTPEKRKIDDLAETLLPDDHPYKIADEHGETNPYKQYLNSVEDEKKMEELGFVKNSDGSWTAQPLGETAQEKGERVHKEMEEKLRNKNWYVDAKTLLKSNWEPKPQTHEEVSDGLKEAFREAVKQGVVSSTKSSTLYDLIADWWDEIFVNGNPSGQNIASLVEQIEQWLPKEQSAEGSQNAYVESAVEGFNDCLNTIKRKLK